MRPLSPMHDDVRSAWRSASEQTLVSRLAPAGVASAAHALQREPLEEPVLAERPRREGRHGPVFGSTVHRALELLLTQRASAAAAAVSQAARELDLTEHVIDAVADVTRAELALRNAGLLQHMLRLEYPIAGSLEPEALLSGYIDLLVASERELLVIDFKTDLPPARDASTEYPGYVAQVQAYGRLLEASGVFEQRTVRTALLFTADGALHWAS
jgi:ATP-dependent helicase/nuclease subunit A